MKSKRVCSLGLAAHLIIGGGALASAVHAEPDSRVPDPQPREVVIGSGTGAVIGGILGGPPGVMLGAMAGNVMGRGSALERELETTRAELAKARAALEHQRWRARLREQHYNTPTVRNVVVASRSALPLDQCSDVSKALDQGMAFTVQFRTNSDRVEAHFARHLRRLVRTMENLPQLRVRLDGFADRRGEPAYNRRLSTRRVAAVQRVLLDAGLSSKRIEVAAHGEDQPLFRDADPENLDFERRVLIRVEP